MPSPEREGRRTTHTETKYLVVGSPRSCSDGLPPGRGHKPKWEGLTSVPLPSSLWSFLPPPPARALSSNHSATFAVARSRRVSSTSDPRARAQSMFLPGRPRSSPWPICGINQTPSPRMTHQYPRGVQWQSSPWVSVCHRVMKGWAERERVVQTAPPPEPPNQKCHATAAAACRRRLGGGNFTLLIGPHSLIANRGTRAVGGFPCWAFVAGRWSLVGRIII